MKQPLSIESLFKEHIEAKSNVINQLLLTLNLDNVIISSGTVKHYFADDMQIPFVTSPFFREWVPLANRQDCFIHLQQNCKPILYLCEVDDIWHSDLQQLPIGWDKYLVIRTYSDKDSLFNNALLQNSRTVFIGSDNVFNLEKAQFNTKSVLDYIDFHRQYKTQYEQYCLRVANQKALPCHLAAKDAFLAGGSELDIQRAFLQVANCRENQVPYPIIAGLNENAAILHHYQLNNTKPKTHNSLLIDAGLAFNCYASDITRTYTTDEGSDFALLLADMDNLQLDVVNQVAAGTTMAMLNKYSHERITELLIKYNFVTTSFEHAFELQLSKSFMPHGIGHGLGVNVHERGSTLCSIDGTPYIRSAFGFEKELVCNEVITVEPGLYFIPALLNQLKQDHSNIINWKNIERFIPYGGIRIEDNILITQDGEIENLTRQS
jgi:Xaa-Pro dipeptidase